MFIIKFGILCSVYIFFVNYYIMSLFQTKSKNNSKAQVKKTKHNKIAKSIPFCDKSDKQTSVEIQLGLPNSASNLTSKNVCTNCSAKMLDHENTADPKSSKDKENKQLVIEKPPHVSSDYSDLDISLLKLPQLHFLNKKPDVVEKESKLYQAQISDLCLEDRQRIVLLIEEVARYKQEKEDNIDEINLLKSQLKESQEKIMILKASESAQLKSLNKMEINHKKEENILKAKLSELSLLLIEMHKQKEITNEQVKEVKVQAEKLTEALQQIHNEKLVIEKLYMNAKEELKLMKYMKDKMTKQTAVKNKIKRKTEEKSCQWSEEEPILEKNTEKVMEDISPAEEIKIFRETKHAVEASDFQILSELFFTNTSVCRQDETLLIAQDHINNKYDFGDIFFD